jgi:hypothetical protein
MRITLLFFVLILASCKQQQLVQSHARFGSVFSALDLPTPDAIRAGSGAPGNAYWQQRADHDIEVELDTENEMIIGSETIIYTNNSPDDLAYMWFHLEQNALRGDSIRSRGGRGSGEDDFAGITVSNLVIDGHVATLHDYGTIGLVELDSPIESGTQVAISLDWTFPFPMIGAMRMGYDDSPDAGAIWELAQWIPVPCVYDDKYGWNNLPYIGSGEFYTNFGDYKVAITVPRDHLVFASGKLVNEKEVLTEEQQERLHLAMESDEVVSIRTSEEVGEASSRPEGEGKLTWIFEGDNIRTFAWGSSASYLWDACSVEVSHYDGTTTRVLCQTAYPEESKKIWKECILYVRHAIEFYSEAIYPYPWPQMSAISGRSRGMEYPMLAYCNGRSESDLFYLADHEIGHSWFPMLINNDERRHAWMDEGFNTFYDHYSKIDYYKGDESKNAPLHYNAKRYVNLDTPVNTPADHLKSRGHLSYHKPAYGLRLLREEIMGEDRFDFAFREYVKRWVFKSPRPADFYRTMEDASGMDLQWFFRGFFEEALMLDQAVVEVTQKNDDEFWDVTVKLQNNQEWVCPVDLTITCSDGSKHIYLLPESIWYWSNQHTHSFDFQYPVIEVLIDEREVYPDIDRTNNSFIVWQ